MNQKELIINKGHSVLILKEVTGVLEIKVYTLSLFDVRGLTLMSLTGKDMDKIKEFLGDDKTEK